MVEHFDVGTNSGIITGGAHTRVDQTNYQLSGALRPADSVPSPAGLMELGAGGGTRLFVGREAELAALERALAHGPGVIGQVVAGLGGVGKSTLARQYATSHRARYNPIWWITAEDTFAISAGLASLGRRLEPALAVLPESVAEDWAKTWLSSHSGWLIVLDNVNEPSDVAGLVTSLDRGSFLITTRATSGWQTFADTTSLDVLPLSESLELMRRIAGEQLMEGGEELCRALDGLPLAVEQSASYMRENHATASEFLQLLRRPDGRALAWTPSGGDAQRTIARIWKVSLDRIEAKHGGAPARLLAILAWFAPDDIPVALLNGIDGLDKFEINDALARLADNALIRRNGDAIAVHRLVQAAVRSAQADGESAFSTAVGVLWKIAPDSDLPDSWLLWRRLAPHVEAVAEHSGGGGDKWFARLLAEAARFLQEQGAPSRAIPLFELALAVSRRVLGDDHQDTLASHNNLARAYQSAGQLAKAIPMLEATLADLRRLVGERHPNTLTARNNVAFAYGLAGDHDKAVPLLEATLDDSSRTLGENHPFTLTVRSNLGYVYRSAGDLEKAIPLFERTLADRQRVLDKDHPDILIARNNLATAYRAAGETGKAIQLFETTLVESVRVLGGDHPLTLTLRNNLGYVYRWAGDLGKAIPLLEATFADTRRVLGEDHPDTVDSCSNLAYAYRAAGDLGKAIPLYEDALAGSRRVLGDDHSTTKAIEEGLRVTRALYAPLPLVPAPRSKWRRKRK